MLMMFTQSTVTISSATGSIYDENTLRESFFMMRNAAPREYDYGSSEYIRRMVEDKQELYELTPEHIKADSLEVLYLPMKLI